MGDVTCLEPECSVKPAARGLCSGHYQRHWTRGTLPSPQLVANGGEALHRLTDVNPEARTATCSVCGPVQMIRVSRGKHGAECSTKRRSQRKKQGRKPGATIYGHSRRPGGVGYKLTRAGRQKMLKDQRGRCAICKRTETQIGEKLFVDHCHKTGRVRGLLCRNCNSGLGFFRDDSDLMWQAFAYLARS
jgi:hypothetical protein